MRTFSRDSDNNCGIVAWRMACRCGSRLCRGTIGGDDWRRPELQARYRDHFSPFINERIRRHRL